MFPTLVAFGPLVIKTLNVFLAIALLVGMFVFWRKGKEEHYDEMELFDGLFLGQLLGILLARIAFIVTHFQRFGFDIIAWVDVFSNPGFNLAVFFLVSGVYLYRFAAKKKWDAFEILDFWVLSVASSHIFVWIGYFFEGIFFGTPTQLPWGLVFPGVFEKHHPIQLYFVVFYVLITWYLSWVEYRYRTFEWYRRGKNTAQTGFLLSVFLIATGLLNLVFTSISVPSVVVSGISLDAVVAGVTFLFGLGLLYARSGRQFFSFKRNARAKKLQQFME